MDSVNDFPEYGPLHGAAVYDNDRNDSSTTISAVFSTNDSIGKNQSICINSA